MSTSDQASQPESNPTSDPSTGIMQPATEPPTSQLAATKLVPPLKWHGGKQYLAEGIIGLMPPRCTNPNAPAAHDPGYLHYVETHFGGGAVLFRQNPAGISEVVNDINGKLINFWRHLQDDRFTSFQRSVEAMPFSQDIFEWSKLKQHSSPLERATAFFVRFRQSRQGLGKDFATTSRNRTRRGMNEQVSSWLTALDGLADAHERLKRVVIFNQDACSLIRQQDHPRTLFYLDPPYLHCTRSSTGEYVYEMSDEQHRELLECLVGIKGRFLLSGYPSEMYNNFAKRHGWNCDCIEIDNKASSAAKKEIKIECIWRNY